MPIYEFRCEDCGVDFEKLVFSSQASVTCPQCGCAEVRRRPSVFGMSGVEKQVRSRDACSGCSASSCTGCGSA